MTGLNVLFMGTPDFAVPCLEKLVRGRDEVALVLTQPDKPRGRGRKPVGSPVKQVALEHGLSVYQPQTLRGKEPFARISATRPDVCVVAAYGKILGKRYLNLPRFGCINVHASLLPRWRGAAPINWAILAGDAKTGVTIMKIAVGLDAGPIVRSWKTPIDPLETAGELHDRLALAGADLMQSVLDELREGKKLSLSPQDDQLATYAPMLDKQDGIVDFHRSPRHFTAHVHGMTPWPGAVCETPRGNLKLCRAAPIEIETIAYATDFRGDPGDSPSPLGTVLAADEKTRIPAPPGTVLVADEKAGLILAVTGGAVRILECQRPGKQVLPAEAYLRGVQTDIVGEQWAGRPAPAQHR